MELAARGSASTGEADWQPGVAARSLRGRAKVCTGLAASGEGVIKSGSGGGSGQKVSHESVFF